MPHDDRDILDVLKFELEYIKKGGYGRSPRAPWRPQLFLEDSPACMNYDTKDNRSPCSECALMQFVPLESRREEVPCRHIPITQAGETIYELYRGGTQQELEEAMSIWLQDMIAQIEGHRAKLESERLAESY